ncbi:MAG: hypothetical protein NC412_09205 [Roseburia sp.]|nr:hypothetical protein [Roseburia sp.]MCM1278826.1 hypothetical protein [Robinsoniella sp.]
MEENKIKNQKRLERMFPEYFTLFELPDGARQERILVYRACKSGKCDKASFTPTFEEKGYKYSADDDPSDPGLYSLSTYEKPNHIKRFAAMTSDLEVPYKIAIGYTEPQYGLVQPTRERKAKKGSHVDWWLYENAKPYEVFEIIPDFEEHLKEYIRKRDEKNE